MDSKARVVFKCEGCGATAPAKEGVKHKEGEAADKQRVVRTCEKAGTSPHVAKS